MSVRAPGLSEVIYHEPYAEQCSSHRKPIQIPRVDAQGRETTVYLERCHQPGDSLLKERCALLHGDDQSDCQSLASELAKTYFQGKLPHLPQSSALRYLATQCPKSDAAKCQQAVRQLSDLLEFSHYPKSSER